MSVTLEPFGAWVGTHLLGYISPVDRKRCRRHVVASVGLSEEEKGVREEFWVRLVEGLHAHGNPVRKICGLPSAGRLGAQVTWRKLYMSRETSASLWSMSDGSP